ncbi:MAG: patatin-like phospholipase family protein, partial [Chthoniobacterales bacterium]
MHGESSEAGLESVSTILMAEQTPDLAAALAGMLGLFFESTSPDLLRLTAEKATFLEVAAGSALFHQDERSDEVYFVLRGRLRAVQSDARGRPVTLGEIGRGETIGELAMILGEPRSASIFALRNSMVARLTREDFESLLVVEPKLALTVARGAVERFRRAERRRNPPRKPVVICLIPTISSVDVRGFGKELGVARSQYGGPVHTITSDDVRREMGQLDGDACEGCHGPVGEWLTTMESSSETMILIADPEVTPWTKRCVSQADEIILLADGDAPPIISEIEKHLFDGEGAAPTVIQTLVLLHPMEKRSPTGTARWLDRRPVDRHFHIRRGHARDIQRLARTLAGRAVGIVLAGGGARAFVHFGVVNALAEFGIEPDFIGGTSMGATAAAWRAMDLTGKDYVDAGRKVYLNKPTSDINLLPMMSFVRGKRVRRITEQAIVDGAGSQIGIEDTWIPYFCIATDLSVSEQAVLNRGSLSRSLLASFSIPGALPPVIINGHLMVDGGTFNNFPVDVMEAQGVGKIIGVVMTEEASQPLGLTELPDSVELFFDS